MATITRQSSLPSLHGREYSCNGHNLESTTPSQWTALVCGIPETGPWEQVTPHLQNAGSTWNYTPWSAEKSLSKELVPGPQTLGATDLVCYIMANPLQSGLEFLKLAEETIS